MNTAHKHKLFYLIIFFVIFTLGIICILLALKKNIDLYLTPSQALQLKSGEHFRLGGVVIEHSLKKKNAYYQFYVRDKKSKLLVQFHGILPDLFREGKGMIASGTLSNQNIFIADEVLAKHDENYQPPNSSDQ